MVRGILCVLVCLCFAPGTFAAPAPTIRVTGDSGYPPFSWFDRQGAHGAAFEIVERVLKQMALPYEEIEAGPFLRVLQAANQGTVDLVVELKDTPDREAYLEFTKTPLFLNPVAIFRSVDKDWKYTGWSSLTGLRGGMTRGNKFGGGLDEYLVSNLSVEEAPSIESNFEKLAAGRIDYFVSSYYPALTQLLATHREAEFSALRPFATATKNYVGIAKAGRLASRVGEFDDLLGKLVASGEAERIVAAYLDQLRSGKLNSPPN